MVMSLWLWPRFGPPCTHKFISASAKNRENESEALAQDDWTVKADWKRWNFRWRLEVDRVSIERMCAGGGFQVEGADTEKAREEKLLVIPIINIVRPIKLF